MAVYPGRPLERDRRMAEEREERMRKIAKEIEGSVVRKAAPDDTAAPAGRPLTRREIKIWEERERRREKERKKKEAHEARIAIRVQKNRDAAKHMNWGYMLFLSAAMFVAGFFLVKYVELRADVTARTKRIAVLENVCNDMKQKNDEHMNRINGSVNLEEIRRVAIYELGMQYAEQGQVVAYQENGSDYVRQYKEITGAEKK